MHSAELHIVERFTLDRERNALRREYVATDPLYFTGEYRGTDAVYPADLPYEAPSCNDLSYKTGQGTLAAQGDDVPAAPAAAPAKPWWMFWK
jgi:hypothetical protein